jgi:hypothetical protein
MPIEHICSHSATMIYSDSGLACRAQDTASSILESTLLAHTALQHTRYIPIRSCAAALSHIRYGTKLDYGSFAWKGLNVEPKAQRSR